MRFSGGFKMFIDINDKKRKSSDKESPKIAPKLETGELVTPPRAYVGEFPTTSRGYRLAARLIDYALAGLTLFIGWAIWSLFTWKEGTTPGHKILGQRVVLYESGKSASWGRMFLREFVIRTFFHVLDIFAFGLFTFADSVLIFRQDKRTLHDLMTGTIVVDDPKISLMNHKFFRD